MGERGFEELFSLVFAAHPWHGVSPGSEAPEIVSVYVEIVPTDVVKYELDKPSGQLRIDRPQRYSSLCPALYGFIPQSFCAEQVAKRCGERTRFSGLRGDGDPLDICVLSERSILHGGFLLRARPIGGLRLVDGNEVDDKIISVLEGDLTYQSVRELSECPQGVLDRLKHYFLSYKEPPGGGPRKVELAEVYDRAEAQEVLRRSFEDYRAHYGEPKERFSALRRALIGS